MIIGLSYNESLTFFIHIEETQGCDYRYFKEFRGTITDYDDVKQDSKIVLFVRDIERGVQNSVDKMGFIMEQEGIVKKTVIGKSEIKLMKANDVYQRTVKEMKKNPHILIKIKREWIEFLSDLIYGVWTSQFKMAKLSKLNDNANLGGKQFEFFKKTLESDLQDGQKSMVSTGLPLFSY